MRRGETGRMVEMSDYWLQGAIMASTALFRPWRRRLCAGDAGIDSMPISRSMRWLWGRLL